jgi:hypothetical protein
MKKFNNSLLFLLAFFPILKAYGEETSTQNYSYSGPHLKVLGGFTLNILKDNTNDFLAQPKVTPLVILGGEYGWEFKDKYYLGLEANFMLYPDILTTEKRTITIFSDHEVPGWAVALVPNVHAHAGYIFDNKIMFTTGLFYLWGLVNTVRIPINTNFAYEFRSLWFYDRVFFNTGIHDFHFSFGLDYKI